MATVAATWVACDSDISGSANENRLPDTELSVRDSSLVDNIAEADRLASSVFVSWSGTDADGFVQYFEIRFAGDDVTLAPEEGWISTSRTDSLVLLPLPPGSATANVVFEVRAVDNDGGIDATPARTVFPIRNSPPTLSLDPAEIPPDTTFGVVSFAWFANDPEGEANLSHVEISLNDTLNFISLPSDFSYITLVGDVDKNDPNQSVTDAQVFSGRGFQTTGITIPGLRLGAENTFYARAVDQTDTTSVRVEHSWFVKKSNSRILFVKDHRSGAAAAALRASYHLQILREFLPPDTAIDLWDISEPYAQVRSPLLPPTAEPALEQLFTGYDYIYWIASNSTNSVTANNFPFAAGVLGEFLTRGGRIFVQSPVQIPPTEEESVGNPAIVVLPLSDFITFPDSLTNTMRITSNSLFTPSAGATTLPELRSRSTILGTLPYIVDSGSERALLEGQYQYRTRSGSSGVWFGSNTVASISTDQQVALLAIPLINTFNGSPYFEGSDGDPEAPRTLVKMMLAELGFPQ